MLFCGSAFAQASDDAGNDFFSGLIVEEARHLVSVDVGNATIVKLPEASALSDDIEMGEIESDFDSFIYDSANSTYDLFSGLDFSSKATAQRDFKYKLNQMETTLTTGKVTWWRSRYRETITQVFHQASAILLG